MSEVIQFRKRETRVVGMDSPVVPTLRASLQVLEQDEREVAIKEARQCIAKGADILRKLAGDQAADEWLIQCMSVVRTVR